jgi:hypothetical protein
VALLEKGFLAGWLTSAWRVNNKLYMGAAQPEGRQKRRNRTQTYDPTPVSTRATHSPTHSSSQCAARAAGQAAHASSLAPRMRTGRSQTLEEVYPQDMPFTPAEPGPHTVAVLHQGAKPQLYHYSVRRRLQAIPDARVGLHTQSGGRSGVTPDERALPSA